MSTAVILALIALIGSLFSTVLTVLGSPIIQERHNATRVLSIYREPLIAAAYELQARIYNILCHQFVEIYINDKRAPKRNAAISSTLYVFAQFFAWREIIRREVQFLRFSDERKTRMLAQLLQDISETFLTGSYGMQFMIWRVEQRGLGEAMAVEKSGKISCLGYASFVQRRDSMRDWLQPIEQDLEDISDAGRDRLRAIQHLLCDLIAELDDKKQRYPFELKRA
jgi:hypothetical protein